MSDKGIDKLELPPVVLREPVFVGVLKVHSPLCSIFTSRIVPLRDIVAEEIALADVSDATEPGACYLIPLELVTPEHLQGLVEWVARRYDCTIEEARARVLSAPDFPVHSSHVAAAMAYRRKGSK